MCGIAGEIGFDRNVSQDNDIFINMQNVLGRRGPDQKGIVSKEHASLIHTRLCVIDIENGMQPMSVSDGENEYIIVYNGELYNTDELRSELKSYGFTFNGFAQIIYKMEKQMR